MKMSSKARYGLYVAVELAKRYSDTEVVSVALLAQCTGVTEKYLEQIIAMMKKADIVHSNRGATGGYKLAKPPKDISVGEILRVLEDNCVSRNLWTKLNENINSYLDTISLQQLVEDKL